MPCYRDHLLFGSVLVLVFSYIGGFLLSYTPEAVLVSAVFVLLASVFPDIDHGGSVVHRKSKAFAVLLAAVVPSAVFYPDPYLVVLGAAAAGSSMALLFAWLKPRHRTVTHSLGAAVGFSAAAGLVSAAAFGSFLPAVFAFLAYYSHLLMDRLF